MLMVSEHSHPSALFSKACLQTLITFSPADAEVTWSTYHSLLAAGDPVDLWQELRYCVLWNIVAHLRCFSTRLFHQDFLTFPLQALR